MALDEEPDTLSAANRLALHTPQSIAEMQELALEMRSLFGGPAGSNLYLHQFVERLCEGCEVLLKREAEASRQCLAA